MRSGADKVQFPRNFYLMAHLMMMMVKFLSMRALLMCNMMCAFPPAHVSAVAHTDCPSEAVLYPAVSMEHIVS